MIGTRSRRAGGNREARLNVHREIRVTAIVHVAHQCFRHVGNAAVGALRRGRHFPSHLRHIGRNPPVNFALEILLNLRAARRPLLRPRHLRSVLHRQHVRHAVGVRIGRGFIESGLIVRVGTAPQCFHAQLIHHVLMIIESRRAQVEPTPMHRQHREDQYAEPATQFFDER